MASTINASTSAGVVTSADTSGVLQLQTAGTTALTVDTSQNVGIGTASPVALGAGRTSVTVNGSTDSILWMLSNGAASGYLQGTSSIINLVGSNNIPVAISAQGTGYTQFITGGTERMRIDSSGNVGIGTVSPAASLSVTKQATALSGTGNSYGLYMYPTSSGLSYIDSITNLTGNASLSLRTYNNGTYNEVRMDSSGNLLVGTTDSSATSGTGFKFKPAGGGSAGQARLDIVTSGSTAATSSYALYSTGASAFRFFVQDSGNINATSTSITAISDISLKENVRDLETGLTEIMALQPRRFDWKEETHLTEKNVAGFIAQEVEQVLPELVYDYQYNATEIKKSLKMGDILPTLVKAMQEQQALITQLQADVAALKENK